MASMSAWASNQEWKKIIVKQWYNQKKGSNENRRVLLMEKTLQETSNNFNMTHNQGGEKISNAPNHEIFSLYYN